MKYKFLRYKTRSYLRRNKTPRASLAYRKAVSVGVIFTVEDRQKHDYIKDFIRKLEHDGKQVKALGFLPPNQENYEFLFDFFTYREISFWGNITATSALTFASTPFDFLIYLDTKPNDLILNLIAKSTAKCRIGKFWKQNEPFFEMMVESNGNSRALIDELYKYTTALK
ncbi:MAG TPA: hypothetical protein VFI14_06175 [Chryseosolibacter sp.]|jgi:hypothetical protein|nr:hypothetical protein [Chryseosolibacter sp.]